jgi:hypothetical protein
MLTQVAIPVLHSSACLLKLATSVRYTGAQSIFIRALLDKKYALPYRVIDAVVEHFNRYVSIGHTRAYASVIDAVERFNSLRMLAYALC